jgi:hypothetical protein
MRERVIRGKRKMKRIEKIKRRRVSRKGIRWEGHDGGGWEKEWLGQKKGWNWEKGLEGKDLEGEWEGRMKKMWKRNNKREDRYGEISKVWKNTS